MGLVLFPLLILCVLAIAGFFLLRSNARSVSYSVDAQEPLSFEYMKSGLAVRAQMPLSFEDMLSGISVTGGIGCGKSRTIFKPPVYGVFNDRNCQRRLRDSTGQSKTRQTQHVPHRHCWHRSGERSRKTFTQFIREQQPAASQK